MSATCGGSTRRGSGRSSPSRPSDAALRSRATGLRDGRPLLGAPTAIEDLAATAGVRTRSGKPVFANYVLDVDDDSAHLRRQAAAAADLALRHPAGVRAQSAVDVVLTPMLAQLPRPVGCVPAGGDPAHDVERQRASTPCTATYNITRQPVLSLHDQWGRDGQIPELPVSLQLVGRAREDALLLALGAQIHNALGQPGDNDRRPPTW